MIFSLTNPKCFATSFPGADSPNSLIPILRPLMPVNLCQPAVIPASRDILYLQLAFKIKEIYSLFCFSNNSQQGKLII